MDEDDRELIDLRRRFAALTEEARKNDDAWRRSQQREMELLEADSLETLLERLTKGLRVSYGLAAATLVLADPEHEVRHLLVAKEPNLTAPPDIVFVDSMRPLAPLFVHGHKPWLGKFRRADHAPLFPAYPRLQSVALLPLTREGHIIGSLNLGSDEGRRFGGHLATDFLHHLAVIAAFCLENAVNRARLIRSGFTDALTGWRNRRYLQTRLHEELARCRRDNTALTCLMIDVDHFKKINDQYGHLGGDEILRQLARCIGTEVRDSDVSARYGGEEFVILLPNTALDAGRVFAERLRRIVSQKTIVLPGIGEPVVVTISIGVAEHRPNATANDLTKAAERLIALADAALYEAKAGGRNAVVHASS